MNRLIAVCLLLAAAADAVLLPGRWKSAPSIPATPTRALSPIRHLFNLNRRRRTMMLTTGPMMTPTYRGGR
jgi:hypothetical protein